MPPREDQLVEDWYEYAVLHDENFDSYEYHEDDEGYDYPDDVDSDYDGY